MHAFTLAAVLIAAVSNAQLISPDTVPSSTRDYWCSQQITACPLLCSQTNHGTTGTIANDCDSDTLNYQCVCADGQPINATEYSQTIPYFECTEFNNRCVDACGLNNTPCQSACRQDHPCGASDPRRYNITSTATTPYQSPTLPAGLSSSAFAGAVATGSADGGDSGPMSFNGDSGDEGAAGILVAEMTRVYGSAAVLGGILAGFMLVL